MSTVRKSGTIVVFSTAYFPFLGGAETAIKGITDNIDNFHFIILTSRFNNSISKSEKIGNAIVYRLGFGNYFDKFLLPFLAFKKFISIRRDLHGPIIFWGMMASQGSIGAWLLKFINPRIPFILTIQEGNNEWRRHSFWWRLIFKKADFVTAISTFLLQKVREAGYLGAAVVIPNGVDLQKFKNNDERLKNGKVIISVSRRVYKNGLDILEKAFEIVKKKFPEAKLIILDKTPHDELSRHLWAADIFVRPSRSEGLGISFLEAMAAGLPIIGTPVGGIPDFLIDGETGLFAKVDDPEDLAQKMELLFSDKELRNKLIANGQKLIEEKYQWSGIANNMESIFRQLI